MTNDQIQIQKGTTLQQQALVQWLALSHYKRVEQVTMHGEFSVTGDRLVVYAVNEPMPIAIDWFGNQIEALFAVNDIKNTRATVDIQSNIVDADGLSFTPGQYVVHLDHGIGQFKTLGVREVGRFGEVSKSSPYMPEVSSTVSATKRWEPFLILEFAEGAEVMVPPSQVQKLTHYIGARAPQLSRLGSKRWHATKKKVEEDLFKLAKDLLVIAAKRQLFTRPPFKLQYDWLKQVAVEFPYDATDDQQKAIDAILADLQKSHPMDRLICGDVGFGKTEVALRAAVAVASAQKQVAFLAPTTLLAEQHYLLLKERLKSLPVRVEHVSRFNSSNHPRLIDDLKQGKIDIMIGTHRLLQEDVEFRDLGLLVIDEEQKFGVKHKELLKKKRAEIDILTLSATPIPRTLFSGLSGLRDISLIITPPKNRLPIDTRIEKADDNKLKQAIEFELSRDGQAFILHNDVASIDARARVLQKLIPNAKIGVAHGQMPEERLAQVMRDMIEKRIDVLLASTIIENGLDIPSANTLIVEKADHFGLSDLYQLRGRVGRSDVQSYALFFYTVSELTPQAQSRFKALIESQELGSGYTVALRDLEIRGGGNVLGKEQHGNMEAIGLSLYTKLLRQTVERLKKQNSTTTG